MAATPAEGLAALTREPSLVLLLARLGLPSASAGLNFVRAARRQRAGLPIAVLEPTRRQRTRREHTVSPPLLSLDLPGPEQLVQLLHAQLGRPGGKIDPPAIDTGPMSRLADLLERYLPLRVRRRARRGRPAAPG